jgi:hypothetical protein
MTAIEAVNKKLNTKNINTKKSVVLLEFERTKRVIQIL